MSILVASDSFLSLKIDMAITKGIQSLARSSFSRPVVPGLYPKTMTKHDDLDCEDLNIDGFLVSL